LGEKTEEEVNDMMFGEKTGWAVGAGELGNWGTGGLGRHRTREQKGWGWRLKKSGGSMVVGNGARRTVLGSA
jgi:hypothetical protein